MSESLFARNAQRLDAEYDGGNSDEGSDSDDFDDSPMKLDTGNTRREFFAPSLARFEHLLLVPGLRVQRRPWQLNTCQGQRIQGMMPMAAKIWFLPALMCILFAFCRKMKQAKHVPEATWKSKAGS